MGLDCEAGQKLVCCSALTMEAQEGENGDEEVGLSRQDSLGELPLVSTYYVSSTFLTSHLIQQPQGTGILTCTGTPGDGGPASPRSPGW